MEELALDSDGGEVDRNEVEEEELATAFPTSFHQQVELSCAGSNPPPGERVGRAGAAVRAGA